MSDNFEPLVEAARSGDEDAFRALVEPLGRELHAYAYRMLGGFHDADDALQESRLKAWRALATYEPRASFRAWMYRIVTHTCLDVLKARSRRVLPQDVGPSVAPGPPTTAPRSDILWLEPYPDAIARERLWSRCRSSIARCRPIGSSPLTRATSSRPSWPSSDATARGLWSSLVGRRLFRSPMLRGFIDTVVRLGGLSPVRFLKSLPRGWPAAYKNWCEPEVVTTADRKATVYFRDVAPYLLEHRQHWVAIEGVLMGLVAAAHEQATVTMSYRVDERLVIADVRW